MKVLFAIGLIAGSVFLSGIPAEAQRRNVYCQPKPLCSNGQFSVCRLYGDDDDACACKSWSGCIGKQRSRTAPASPGRTQQRPVPPRIQIPSTR